MNFTRTLTLPLLAALLLSSACREGGPLGPAPIPAAGTGGGAGASGGAAPGSSAVATLAGFMGGTVTGTATFTKGATTDVVVTVALTNCVAGKVYPVHIHSGTSCADAVSQGGHWGPTRGEGIMSVTCVGTAGMSTTTRAATDPTLAWTIGGDITTNVVNHAFVVHAPDVPMDPPRIACGVITLR